MTNNFTLENDHLRLVIVPSLGAKIASLVDKHTGFEWLAPPTRPIRERREGDLFVEHDLSGWDETFPTILPCPSPHDPTVMLPSHGEVWALPWDVEESTPFSLTLSVKGRLLNYTLTRTVTLTDEKLHLAYTVQNHTGRDFPFLWAAHPLFNAAEGCTVELPKTVTQVVNAVQHPQLGAPDTVLNWANADLGNGQTKRLDIVRDASLKEFHKFYVPPTQGIASAALRQGNVARKLIMVWDSSVAPYLGVWVDEGTYTKTATVALEPATGYYDSLALAQANGRVSIVPKDGEMRWWMQVAFAGV
jgi:galactose mutarotase-like enzyme